MKNALSLFIFVSSFQSWKTLELFLKCRITFTFFTLLYCTFICLKLKNLCWGNFGISGIVMKSVFGRFGWATRISTLFNEMFSFLLKSWWHGRNTLAQKVSWPYRIIRLTSHLWLSFITSYGSIALFFPLGYGTKSLYFSRIRLPYSSILIGWYVPSGRRLSKFSSQYSKFFGYSGGASSYDSSSLSNSFFTGSSSFSP